VARDPARASVMGTYLTTAKAGSNTWKEPQDQQMRVSGYSGTGTPEGYAVGRMVSWYRFQSAMVDATPLVYKKMTQRENDYWVALRALETREARRTREGARRLALRLRISLTAVPEPSPRPAPSVWQGRPLDSFQETPAPDTRRPWEGVRNDFPWNPRGSSHGARSKGCQYSSHFRNGTTSRIWC